MQAKERGARASPGRRRLDYGFAWGVIVAIAAITLAVLARRLEP